MISTLSWLMMPIHHDRLSQAAHSQTDLVMEFCGDRVEWGEGANQETEYWCYSKEIMAAGSAAQLGSVDFERGKLSFTNIKRIAACLPNGKTACVLVRAPTKFHPKILYLSQLWRLSTQFLSTRICIWQKKDSLRCICTRWCTVGAESRQYVWWICVNVILLKEPHAPFLNSQPDKSWGGIKNDETKICFGGRWARYRR